MAKKNMTEIEIYLLSFGSDSDSIERLAEVVTDDTIAGPLGKEGQRNDYRHSGVDQRKYRKGMTQEASKLTDDGFQVR